MACDFISENQILADNRKNFRVIRRSGKTLIFYRRVQSGSSGIAMYNETDDVQSLTSIPKTTLGATRPGRGWHTAMDFWCRRADRTGFMSIVSWCATIRSPGSYVQRSATLKVYRRRVQSHGNTRHTDRNLSARHSPAPAETTCIPSPSRISYSHQTDR